LKLQISEPTVPVKTRLTVTRDLYNHYGGMLLGYLTDIVKDQQLAEKYLVDIFRELPEYVEDYLASDRSIWVQLQALTKLKLSSFFGSQQDCEFVTDDIHQKWSRTGSQLANMSALQRTVFCGMYYHHKSLNVIADEVGESEDVVKRILREVFIKIRHGR
jgi:hypothetical protein